MHLTARIVFVEITLEICSVVGHTHMIHTRKVMPANK